MEQVFVGRDAELTTISQRLAAAADGHAGVVWIEADAGFGKTALVRRILGTLPDGFVVISAEADELAREQPFGVASQLGATRTADPLGVGLELLRLTGERQDHRPAVVVVEDMHWADARSREALASMARRLDAECVALLLTSRPGGGDADGWDRIVNDEMRCCTIRLGAVSEQQVGEWAHRIGIGLTAAQAARLHRHTGGHPLYVKTLLHELTPEQLTSSMHDLPAPRSLASATIGALAELPENANQLASALAVLGQRTPLAVVARVAGVAEPAAALESLLKTGFLQWFPEQRDTPIDFVHPLYRLAVYDDLSPTRRQLLHRAAAGNLGRVAGWPHRVAAADSADDRLADELDTGAAAEIHRGNPSLAAKYLLWAAPLTSRRAVADTRLLRGADCYSPMASSTASSSSARHRGLRPHTAARSGARQLRVRGGGRRQRAAAVIRCSDTRGRGPRHPGRCAHAGGQFFVMRGEPRRQAQAAKAALALDAANDEIARTAWGSLVSAEFTLNGAPAALTVLGRRLPDHAGEIDGADAELLVVRGLLDCLRPNPRRHQRSSGRNSDVQGRALASAYARCARLPGPWPVRRRGLGRGTGPHEVARAIADDARHGWMRGRAEFVSGAVAAARGQWDDAQASLAEVERAAAGTVDTTWAEMLARILKSAICRARADAEGVIDALRPLASDTRIVVSQMAMIAWWPILIEGLIEAGETADAAVELDRVTRYVDDTGMDIGGQLAGLRARLAAAAGQPDEAARLFELAIATIRPDDGLLDRALLRHRYGRLLHARGNRREAVDHLRAAHEIFAGVAQSRTGKRSPTTWRRVESERRQSDRRWTSPSVNRTSWRWSERA